MVKELFKYTDMKEIRCKCGSLLMKGEIEKGKLEIKCKKCKHINEIKGPFQDRIILIKK